MNILPKSWSYHITKQSLWTTILIKIESVENCIHGLLSRFFVQSFSHDHHLRHYYDHFFSGIVIIKASIKSGKLFFENKIIKSRQKQENNLQLLTHHLLMNFRFNHEKIK